jgi:hypothetical protein
VIKGSKKKTVANFLTRVNSPVGVLYHPAKYLESVRATDIRKNINAIACMPYPADPLVEPEYEGLTYFQVAVLKQAELAARFASLESLEFISDRVIGKPAQINLNVNATESYEQFLEKIAEAEEAIIVRKEPESFVLE